METPFDSSAPGAALFTPVEVRRASEAIYEQVKDLIVGGKLNPGDRLPSERNMMELFQRSRPTIREALRMLEREGFIRTIPGTNGAVVQAPGTRGVEQSLEVMLQTSHIQLAELTEYRLQNEIAVARWAAERRSEEDLNGLRELLEQSEALLGVGDWERFIALDPVFHRDLAMAAKNNVAYLVTQVLRNLVENLLKDKLQKLGAEDRKAMCYRILHMHQEIFDKVLYADEDGAGEAMRVHLDAIHLDLMGLES